MSEVDTVWAWGGQTSTPPINKYLSEIFSPSHIKLTNNNSNKDSKSVKRPWGVEKFKLDRKIFSSWKIRKLFMSGIRTHDLPRECLKSYPLNH